MTCGELNLGMVLKNSLKIRKVIDKLSDNDINVLAEFLENNDLEKISKFGILKFFGKHPNLLKVLTELR